MARIRSFKPEVFTDRKTGTLSDGAFKIFMGMWTHADDFGVIQFDPDELRVRILPFTEHEAGTDRIRAAVEVEIVPRGLADIFTVKGRLYVWIRNFKRHQRINRPSHPSLDGWKDGATPADYVKTHGGLLEPSMSTHPGRKEGTERSGAERSEFPISTSAPSASATAPAPGAGGLNGAEPDGTVIPMATIAAEAGIPLALRTPSPVSLPTAAETEAKRRRQQERLEAAMTPAEREELVRLRSSGYVTAEELEARRHRNDPEAISAAGNEGAKP